MLNSSKDAIIDILLKYTIYPFTKYNSSCAHFPFDSMQNTKLMKSVISHVINSLRNIYTSSAKNEFPIIFMHITKNLVMKT